MPRRLSRSFQVALVFLVSSPGLLAQHGGSAGAMSSAHFGGTVHAGPSPSFSGPSHSFAPPSGPFFAGPAGHSPSLQAGQSRHWPSANPSHRPNDGRQGVGYRGPA